MPPYFDSFAEYKEFCVQYRSKLSQIVRATAGWLPEQARAGHRRQPCALICCSPHSALSRVSLCCPSMAVDGHRHTLPGHGVWTHVPVGTVAKHVARKCSVPCCGESHQHYMRPCDLYSHLSRGAGASGRHQAAAGGTGGRPSDSTAVGTAGHGGLLFGSRHQLSCGRAPRQRRIPVPTRRVITAGIAEGIPCTCVPVLRSPALL